MSGDGRFQEQKTEMKGIMGIPNLCTTDVVSCNNKKGGKDQELTQSGTTPDPGYHKGK